MESPTKKIRSAIDAAIKPEQQWQRIAATARDEADRMATVAIACKAIEFFATRKQKGLIVSQQEFVHQNNEIDPLAVIAACAERGLTVRLRRNHMRKFEYISFNASDK